MRRTIVLLLLGLVLPMVAQAATYQVSPGGLAGGLAQLSAGDTLYLRGGTYNESINASNQTIPTGTGWGPGQVVTIASYPGETAILAPQNAGTVVDFNAYNTSYDIQYIIFDRIIFDANNNTLGVMSLIGNPNGSATHHLRFQESEIRNSSGCGGGYHIVGPIGEPGPTGQGNQVNVAMFDNVHHVEFLRSKIHHSWCGYGFYVSGSDNLWDGNEIYDNAGFGIQIYPSGNNNVIRNNRFYGNGIVRNFAAITINNATNTQIYNNVIYNNNAGIENGINSTVSNTTIYNNTFYGNAGSAIQLGASTVGAIVANNIVYGNNSQISNNGGASFSSNLCGSNQAGLCDPTLTGDPGFVSAPGGDFHIALAGSKAVNCCPRLAGVETDAEGFNRTNPTAAGAYEFGASCIPGNCPTGCCGNSCCPPNPEPGTLLAHWTFDEGAGTTAADTAPLAGDYPCELTSAGWVSPGIIGASAFSLNGSRSCQISGVPQQANLALSLWIKGTVMPASLGCMFAIGDSIEVCIDSTGRPKFTVFTDTYHTITGPSVTQDGTPHHLVVSYHAVDAMRMWDNGAQVAFAEATGDITYPFGTLTQIGRYFTDNQYAYTGVIDQVRAYAAPLAQADVDSLRNEQVPTGGTAVHDMAFYDADAAEGVNGVVNADLTSLLTTPKGIRWGLRNASGADITEYFKPFCRVNTGAGYGGWVEVDNSFGSDGIRFHTDTVKNLGDATTNLLPLDGAIAGGGKFIVDTVDTTSPYDAVQKITMANGAQVEMEVRVDFGSPLGNGHLVQCKPRRESGADLTEYGGPGDQAIRTLTVQTLAPVSGIRIGGAVTGGTER